MPSRVTSTPSGSPAGTLMFSSVPSAQRDVVELGDDAGDEPRGVVEVEVVAEAEVHLAVARDCWETAIAGSPSTMPSSAAATVPE